MLLSLVASVLPTFLLDGLREWLGYRKAIATDKERTRRELSLRAIDGIIIAREQRAATQRVAMSHKTFWYVWAFFAIPVGLWHAGMMVDTLFQVSWLSVPMPPGPFQPYVDMVYESIFWSGGGVAGAQVLAKAIGSR